MPLDKKTINKIRKQYKDVFDILIRYDKTREWPIGRARIDITLDKRVIKKLKEKQRPGTIIPDGPQGPRFKVKLGIIILARETGYPILPFSYSAKKIKVFASWDRFILPYPFTKCLGIYGKPFYVPKDADKDDLMRYRNLLEKELNCLTIEADSCFSHKIA